MSLANDRLSYLLTIDMVRKVQRWWRNVAPSMRDTYKCPVCINIHPVSRAVAGFSCNHIMCFACYEAWERQCNRENRASTCPTCRACRSSSHNNRDEYDRTLSDIWISSPTTTVAEEIIRNALQNTYITNTFQDNIMIHHAPTIRRMMRDTQVSPSVHNTPHSIVRDVQDFVSRQVNGENITNTLDYDSIQRAIFPDLASRSGARTRDNSIDIQTSLGYY
jgi:hypothetical protein